MNKSIDCDEDSDGEGNGENKARAPLTIDLLVNLVSFENGKGKEAITSDTLQPEVVLKYAPFVREWLYIGVQRPSGILIPDLTDSSLSTRTEEAARFVMTE